VRPRFELSKFQREDTIKLARAGRGAIGSEMGSGKTHIAIALDTIWFSTAEVKAPTLVVCPINVFGSWVEKYKWQSPETDVYVIDRKNRQAFIQAIKKGKADVYIMHWDALRLLPELSKIRFNTVIADEAHRASNRKAQATQALKQIPAVHKLALSGTLSGDQPQNLWSVLNWLWPKQYTSFWKFDKHYVIRGMDDTGTYQVVKGVKNAASLKEEMAPWYVRPRGRDVLPSRQDLRHSLGGTVSRAASDLQADEGTDGGLGERSPVVTASCFSCRCSTNSAESNCTRYTRDPYGEEAEEG
jgi:hypothetical protein